MNEKLKKIKFLAISNWKQLQTQSKNSLKQKHFIVIKMSSSFEGEEKSLL